MKCILKCIFVLPCVVVAVFITLIGFPLTFLQAIPMMAGCVKEDRLIIDYIMCKVEKFFDWYRKL